MLVQTDATFSRIQQQSHGLTRTVSKGSFQKKRERRRGEKRLFHLNRDRGEERRIRRDNKKANGLSVNKKGG